MRAARIVLAVLCCALIATACGDSGARKIEEAAERRRAAEKKLRDEAQAGQSTAQQAVDLVTVPGGPFKMGDNSLGGLPERQVDVPTFQIGRFEVTNAEYAKYVLATNAIAPYDWELSEPPADRMDQPVCVPQVDAKQFARWMGCRLPTRAEWEKAARGTDGRKYPWGNTFDSSLCNTIEAGVGDTVAVNSYPGGESPYGCLNMCGNVREWTADTVATDEGERGVLKGGSFMDEHGRGWLRCAFEFMARPTVEKNPVNGFRLARDVN